MIDDCGLESGGSRKDAKIGTKVAKRILLGKERHQSELGTPHSELRTAQSLVRIAQSLAALRNHQSSIRNHKSLINPQWVEMPGRLVV